MVPFEIVADVPTTGTVSVVVNPGPAQVALDARPSVAFHPPTFAVGGVIQGLTGSGLILSAPGFDDLAVASGATRFSLTPRVLTGTSYALRVKTHPEGQLCSVTVGEGTVERRDVTTIFVNCAFGWSSVATGEGHGAGVADDGTLWTWGSNLHGQLGDGTNVSIPSPMQLAVDFAAVAAGQAQTYAVKRDGTLWAWGANGQGQLGDGTTFDANRPVQIGSGFSTVSAGREHGVAIRADGTLWTWGASSYCTVGSGIPVPCPVPTQIGAGFVRVATGDDHNLAIMQDGSLWAWGSNTNGQLGTGTRDGAPRPLRVGEGFAAVAAGYAHSLAVKTNGTLWAWGANSNGQVGNGARLDTSLPTPVGEGFAAVAGGYNHSAAVKRDGTLWTWGANEYGQLGNGTALLYGEAGQALFPAQVGSGFTSVVSRGRATLAIRAGNGALWSWGYNTLGEIGRGAAAHQFAPVRVGTGYTAVSAGRDHGAGIRGDGTLWAWGYSPYGQVGDGRPPSSTTANVGESADVGPLRRRLGERRHFSHRGGHLRRRPVGMGEQRSRAARRGRVAIGQQSPDPGREPATRWPLRATPTPWR